MVIDDFWQSAIKEAKISLLIRGNSCLIPSGDIKKFLDWVDGKKTLLGAEGFRYDGKIFEPLLDCIIDYSHGNKTASIDFHKEAISTDPAWRKAQYVEFVFGD